MSGAITTGGGSLTSYSGDTTLQIPAGTFTDTVNVTHSPAYGTQPGGNLAGIGHVFDLTAVYPTGAPAEPSPGHTYTVSVEYTSDDLGTTIEDTLALYYWDGGQWVMEPSSTLDTTTNLVTATPDHFSLWAVLGATWPVYLPFILKY